MLPLYRGDEDFILCDMPLAKCYALVHSRADQNGVATVWADEDDSEDQASILQQAREIMRNNYLFRDT